MVELPTRFTQRWIEDTFPRLNEADADRALNAMRRRGWTDDDFEERVYPHLAPLELPEDVTPAWLGEHLPRRSAADIEQALTTLETRGWPAIDLAVHVVPHLVRKASNDDVAGIVDGLRKEGMDDSEIREFIPALAYRPGIWDRD